MAALQMFFSEALGHDGSSH